jgi:putative pyruvate formate lyase activating enzyme
MRHEPAYLRAYEEGRLAAKVEEAIGALGSCTLCPRNCKADRLADRKAACKTGRHAWVASHFPHFGEEDCLRGWKGSGTIFFSHCNLRCVFCQNFDISQAGEGEPATAEAIALMMLRLQAHGCHNINFVTPEHVVPQILEALPLAIARGLSVPLVYNTSAYDSMHSMALMEGVVDIYMPDFKYWDPEKAFRYLKARDYPGCARDVIREMHRQVGPLVTDRNGLAVRGVLVRHLVMPGGLDDTRQIMRWLAHELSPDTYVNVMAQYRPAGKVDSTSYPELDRRITVSKVEEARRIAREEGIVRFDERQPFVEFVA